MHSIKWDLVHESLCHRERSLFHYAKRASLFLLETDLLDKSKPSLEVFFCKISNNALWLPSTVFTCFQNIFVHVPVVSLQAGPVENVANWKCQIP